MSFRDLEAYRGPGYEKGGMRQISDQMHTKSQTPLAVPEPSACNHDLELFSNDTRVRCKLCGSVALLQTRDGQQYLHWLTVENETVIEAKARWRREGRIHAVKSAHRIKMGMADKHKKGVFANRAEQAEWCWQQMIERYPPLEIPIPEKLTKKNSSYDYRKIDVERVAILDDSSKPKVMEDVQWAYSNLERPEISEAPTRSALAMLKWARANRDAFMRDMVYKMMAIEEKMEMARIKDAEKDERWKDAPEEETPKGGLSEQARQAKLAGTAPILESLKKMGVDLDD